MSYANTIMYSAVLPSFDDVKKADTKEKVINADDPKNQQAIKKELYG